MRERRFWLTLEVSDGLLREQPLSMRETARRWIEAQTEVRGPRGGRYVLTGPVDRWDESRDHADAFIRGVTVIGGRRPGKYVRPRRAIASRGASPT